ncbi:MAG: type II toxin-antitoxin system RelE/ParE family toxin [Rhodospirillales bacterium]|nr:type II toxin-antitoxin system RelE/ParE family toxin [Rhodospirillales bacterium]
MAWAVEFSEEAENDFELIFDHLFDSYADFGETLEDGFERAARRVMKIRKAGEDIAKAPHRGTIRDDIVPGLRNVTIDRAIFWFDLDDDHRIVRILGVFFGGQDHIRRMMVLLLG